MVSCDVKAHVKQQDKDIEVPLRLEIQCKSGMYFSFNFAWYSIKLDIAHQEKGVGGFM